MNSAARIDSASAGSTAFDSHVVRLTIAYLGAGFCGWQYQPDQRSVQSELEEALSQVWLAPVRAIGAGRTDAGVHADAQEVHLRLSERLRSELSVKPLTLRDWVNATNHYLPADVRVLSAFRMPAGFDSRRAAVNKRYRYRFWRGGVMTPLEALRRTRVSAKIDLERVQPLAHAMQGQHDFSAFAKTGGSNKTTIRTVNRCELEVWDAARVDLVVEGRGFLRGMVRAMAGTLCAVAGGRISESDFHRLLEGGSRSDAGPNAPAHGLTLESVSYSIASIDQYPTASHAAPRIS